MATYRKKDATTWLYALSVVSSQELVKTLGEQSRGIVISQGLLGHALDPSTPLEERDVEQLGAGIWNRVLIDATRNWSFKRRPEWNNERFPPTVAPAPEDEALVLKRWKEYGFE